MHLEYNLRWKGQDKLVLMFLTALCFLIMSLESLMFRVCKWQAKWFLPSSKISLEFIFVKLLLVVLPNIILWLKVKVFVFL